MDRPVRYGWSLEVYHWQQLRDHISGRDWRRAFLEHDYTSGVPTKSGVYVICAGLQNVPIRGILMEKLYNTIYAGQASNLNRRFKEHLKGYKRVVKAKKVFQRLHFWYIEVDASELKDIEQILLDAFGPSANLKNVKARIGDPRPAGRARGKLR